MLMLRGGESQDGYGAETDEPPRKEDGNADPDVRTVTGDWLDLSGQDHLSTTVKSIGVRELICMFLVSFKRSWIFQDGTESSLRMAHKKAGDAYKLKHDILGPERHNAQESLVLGSTNLLD